MKKISVTLWIILAGILIYIGSLWQRPLFLQEYTEFSEALSCMLKNSIPSWSGWLNIAVLKLFGITPFSLRIVPALFALAAGAAIFLAGKRSSFSNTGAAGALIFLLSPAVFLAGTVSIHPMYAAAPAITGAFALFILSCSSQWKTAVLSVAAAVISLGILLIEGSIFLWSTLLAVQILFLLSGKFFFKTLKIHPHYSLFSLLTFILTALWGFRHAAAAEMLLPDFDSIQRLAAVIGAGFFPWIFFVPAAVRNFRDRIAAVCADGFTFFALLLAVAGTAAALLLPLSSGAIIIAFAGFAILLAAGIEAEWLENGFRTCNIILYIIAGIFILLALATALIAALGMWTNCLPPVWKIFSRKEVWALNVLVPVVTAVWCFTAAGEKIYKDRKFLALCAGVAFGLFAIHGIVPQKIVEKNAPSIFIRQVILPRISSSTILRADSSCRIPLQSAFTAKQVGIFDFHAGKESLKREIKSGKKLCIMLNSRQTAKQMPFPKTVISAGNFCAVFYNIDFPEMQVRKP